MMETPLDATAEAALAKATSSPLSYRVKKLSAPDGRTVVLLGEMHVKLPHAKRIGLELVKAFELRGVEGFPRTRVFAGRGFGFSHRHLFL
jgi:hypothetical protein